MFLVWPVSRSPVEHTHTHTHTHICVEFLWGVCVSVVPARCGAHAPWTASLLSCPRAVQPDSLRGCFTVCSNSVTERAPAIVSAVNTQPRSGSCPTPRRRTRKEVEVARRGRKPFLAAGALLEQKRIFQVLATLSLATLPPGISPPDGRPPQIVVLREFR